MFDLQENAMLGFKLYMPKDFEKFRKEFNLKDNKAQTILYLNNSVKDIIIQDMDGDDYTAILRQAKKALRRLNQFKAKIGGKIE